MDTNDCVDIEYVLEEKVVNKDLNKTDVDGRCLQDEQWCCEHTDAVEAVKDGVVVDYVD